MSNYDLSGSIKSFAVDNEFTRTLNKVCYELGTKLTPFCICADEFQKKYNVVDLSTFGGFNNSSKTLVEDIYEERLSILKADGIGIPSVDNEEMLKKTLFYQYLMTVSICYVEVEKWKTVNGQSQKTYDKFLCTRNPAIMGAWMGMNSSDMQAKYSAKVKSNSHEIASGRLRFVKLNQSAKGNSITVPRVEYYTDKIRCVPLFMLYAFTEGMKTKLENGIVEFVFLKDNHTERKMYSTLNKDILMDFYNDNVYVNTMLSGVDINSVKQGGMMLSSKANRGYIKVPELGASIYDATGTRSLNVARVLSAKEVSADSVDRTFINVSLSSVVANFGDCLDYCLKNMPDALPEIYKSVMEQESDEGVSEVTLINNMNARAISNETLFSTQYQRWLHSFMIGNPQWFPLYTGVPKQEAPSRNFGVAPMDF